MCSSRSPYPTFFKSCQFSAQSSNGIVCKSVVSLVRLMNVKYEARSASATLRLMGEKITPLRNSTTCLELLMNSPERHRRVVPSIYAGALKPFVYELVVASIILTIISQISGFMQDA